MLARNADQTRAIGERFAEVLQPGDVVLLAGDLGCGKTTITQGIAKGLGIEAPITSPTFVLAREHPLEGDRRFVHADAYRLESFGELEDMVEDLVGKDTITVVEWGDVVGEALEAVEFIVRLDHVDQGRTILIQATDPSRQEVLNQHMGESP